jgi:hypothetical protein
MLRIYACNSETRFLTKAVNCPSGKTGFETTGGFVGAGLKPAPSEKTGFLNAKEMS